MAVTKTDFINYTRCSRYVALEEVRHEKLDADISYDDYKKQEERDILKELLAGMFEDETYEVDTTIKVNKQMQAMKTRI